MNRPCKWQISKCYVLVGPKNSHLPFFSVLVFEIAIFLGIRNLPILKNLEKKNIRRACISNHLWKFSKYPVHKKVWGTINKNTVIHSLIVQVLKTGKTSSLKNPPFSTVASHSWFSSRFLFSTLQFQLILPFLMSIKLWLFK